MKTLLIVLDSFGIGALPDAEIYGDQGSNTIKSAVEYGGAELKNMRNMGLFNIDGVECGTPVSRPCAAYGRAAELSPGKDTTTGHWELMGAALDKPFPTFPNGFPQKIITKLEELWGRKIIGNCAESGTEIIKRLGKQHQESGAVIVYTSADSVLQVAAHVDVISIEELYNMCQKAREIMSGEFEVGRVIARPFRGKDGAYERLPQRKDYSVRPPKTLLNVMQNNGMDIIGIGKISDIFAGSGITESFPVKGNEECLSVMFKEMKRPFNGLMFVNLVDFDMLYGHRNDPEGYAKALESFDYMIPQICRALMPEDAVIITADHGCDPYTESTDHSREYIPVLYYGQNIIPKNMGTMSSFSCVGRLIARRHGLWMPGEEKQ
ncbi:MAG: phosphopentomutase [Clostridiales bacterium]|nr:phosphopentomutase [Clostridiales bacterium]